MATAGRAAAEPKARGERVEQSDTVSTAAAEVLAIEAERLGAAVPDRDPTTAALVVWLTRLARLHEAALARRNAEHDLLPSETAVLLVLWLAGPPHRVRPSFLAEATMQTSGGMTATLRRLTEAGLIERVPDPNDGRVLAATLTAHGAEVGLASYAAMVDWFDAALGERDAAERRALLAGVRTLIDVLEGAADADAGGAET